MTDPATIIATYEANEKAMRAIVPGGFLLPEDVRTCVEMAAEEHGASVDGVTEILKAHWIKEPV